MAYRFKNDDLSTSSQPANVLNDNQSFLRQNPDDLEHFLHTDHGHFFSHTKHLLLKRKRADLLKIIKKSLALILSPRTILVQLEAFLCSFAVSHLDSLKHFTRNFGESVDMRVITLMISLCVVVSINQSFARRERTLRDIARLKTSLIMVYYAMAHIFDADADRKRCALLSVKNLMRCLSQYIYDRNQLMRGKLHSAPQNRAVQRFYCDINRLLKLAFASHDHHHDPQLNSRIPPPIISFLTSKINDALLSFERLCATKDYLTPLGIRAFMGFMLWLLPVLLAPYFVWHTERDMSGVASYGWAWLFFLMLGALVDVKNILDDIFDGDSADDDVVIDVKGILHNMQYGASPLVQDLYHQEHT